MVLIEFFIISSALRIVLHSDGAVTETCGLTQRDGINTFTLHAASPIGEIPLIYIQFDTKSKLPLTSTVIYDSLNLQRNVDRADNFRPVDCASIHDDQQNCKASSKMFRMSTSQKEKIAEKYKSWDRGHLTPANPMKFSTEAADVTFYCVNIAPQEPWCNRCPWYAVEERTLNRTSKFPSFVITGVSGINTADGNTEGDLVVPEVFWKMSCYVNPETRKTEVVGFIGNNTLIPAASITEGRKERKASTILPRSQKEVLELIGANAKYVNKAWTAAEKDLTKGRETIGLPTAASCIKAKVLSDESVADWTEFMKVHRNC